MLYSMGHEVVQAPQQPTIGWLITFSWLVDVIPSDQPKWLVDGVSINQPSGVDEGLMRNPLTAAVGNVYCASEDTYSHSWLSSLLPRS
jgi:hypothetical protein